MVPANLPGDLLTAPQNNDTEGNKKPLLEIVVAMSYSPGKKSLDTWHAAYVNKKKAVAA